MARLDRFGDVREALFVTPFLHPARCVDAVVTRACRCCRLSRKVPVSSHLPGHSKVNGNAQVLRSMWQTNPFGPVRFLAFLLLQFKRGLWLRRLKGLMGG